MRQRVCIKLLLHIFAGPRVFLQLPLLQYLKLETYMLTLVLVCFCFCLFVSSLLSVAYIICLTGGQESSETLKLRNQDLERIERQARLDLKQLSKRVGPTSFTLHALLYSVSTHDWRSGWERNYFVLGTEKNCRPIESWITKLLMTHFISCHQHVLPTVLTFGRLTCHCQRSAGYLFRQCWVYTTEFYYTPAFGTDCAQPATLSVHFSLIWRLLRSQEAVSISFLIPYHYKYLRVGLRTLFEHSVLP